MAKKKPRKATTKDKAATAKTETLEVPVSRCPMCQSTERTAYHTTRELEYTGINANHQPYTHVVWRRTSCASCGQVRIDKSFENREPVTP